MNIYLDNPSRENLVEIYVKSLLVIINTTKNMSSHCFYLSFWIHASIDIVIVSGWPVNCSKRSPGIAWLSGSNNSKKKCDKIEWQT